MDEIETIERAAILHGGIIYDVPRPGRHHDVLRLMDDMGRLMFCDLREQGFTTSTGRFVDRSEAFAIALASGQLVTTGRGSFGADGRCHIEGTLFSEDVW